MMLRSLVSAVSVLALSLSGTTPAAATGVGAVFPTLQHNLVAHYDFEHAAGAVERDQGRSGTDIALLNGAPRVRDGFRHALQARQQNPGGDWKAGVYDADGVSTLDAFTSAREATVMGWFKMTGANPSPNTNTPDPADYYNAVGLAGVLTGDSDGHAVRALLEVIAVNGELKVVALGRRVDGGASQTFAASAPWQEVLPVGEWVFLAATFNFDNGKMALYRNGKALPGFYTVTGDPWELAGDPEPDRTTAVDSRGIKIGGSFPQNTREQNPCDCRMDELMFLNRVVTPTEIWLQYNWARARV